MNWSRTPLDWCREWAINCGRPAADAYCVTMGFERAERFIQGGKLPKTMTIGDKRVCTGKCDSFASIKCVKD